MHASMPLGACLLAVFALAVGCADPDEPSPTPDGAAVAYFAQVTSANETQASRLATRAAGYDATAGLPTYQATLSKDYAEYAAALAAMTPPSDVAATHQRLVDNVQEMVTDWRISSELTATPPPDVQDRLFRGADAAYRGALVGCRELARAAAAHSIDADLMCEEVFGGKK
ncbi:MAG TPA: hypothetical protein VJP07_00555 [Dehalococcoidia bacterium]|nr:hypothetical protein [Dehalococcoidia bacterium]